MTTPVIISPVTGRPQKGKPCINKNRPGKVTQKEKEIRIEQLAKVIGGQKPLTKHEIRTFCEREWKLRWRQSDRYAAYARELLIKATSRSKTELVSEAWSFYESILRSPQSTIRDRMQARAEMNRLLGLYAPTGIRVADEQGKPLQAVVAPVVNFIMPPNGREEKTTNQKTK